MMIKVYDNTENNCDNKSKKSLIQYKIQYGMRDTLVW